MFIPIAIGRGKGDLVLDFQISDMGFQIYDLEMVGDG